MTRCRLLPWLTLAILLVPSVRGQEFPWRKDYSAARQDAAKTGRPLLLHFTTTGCVWCQRLEQTTYRDPVVFKAMTEQFLSLKIDYEQYQKLCEDLQVQNFPTIVIAGPTGRILDVQKGYIEAAAFREMLGKALTRVEEAKPAVAVAPAPKPEEKPKPVEATPVAKARTPPPEPPTPVSAPPAAQVEPPSPPPPATEPVWMLTDFRTASEAAGRSEYPRAVHLLRGILKDFTDLPVQVRAQGVLRAIEKQAAERLARVKDAESRAQFADALQQAQDLVRRYDGTDAAAQGLMKLSQLSGRIDERDREHIKQARGLLALAREDFRSGQWLPCLLRCEDVLASYSDLSQESGEASDMAGQIRANPERLQKICDGLPEVLGLVYLTTAESKLKQGEPQQAVFFLERILQAFPNSKHAEMAQVRLAQIQGPPALSSEERKP